MATQAPTASTPAEFESAKGSMLRRLRPWNIGVGLLHAGQAALILALANDFALPVTASFLDGPPGTDSISGPNVVFNLQIGPAVAVFLLLAAVDHLLVASPRIANWYERNLLRGVNFARWWEYSVSASIMVVLIAMLTGISDLAALIAVFGVNAAMILFGLLMETANRPGQPVDWRPFRYGSIVGAVPWIAIAFQLGYSQNQTGNVPTFVFVIFVTLFVLFFSFAVNMALQYAGVGRWADYLYGERAYIFLSVTAKSALAWQIFGSTLAA